MMTPDKIQIPLPLLSLCLCSPHPSICFLIGWRGIKSCLRCTSIVFYINGKERKKQQNTEAV